MNSKTKKRIPWNKGKKGVQTAWNKGKKGKQKNHNTSGLIKGGWNKGKKMSDEFKKKVSLAGKGRKAWNKGKKLSEEHKKKLSLAKIGKRPWNYTGKPRTFQTVIRTSVPYRKWRTAIFIRDHFTCMWCGQIGGKLNADHYPISFKDMMKIFNIDSYEKALKCELLWDISNGRTLCEKCHSKTDNYKGKANKK